MIMSIKLENITRYKMDLSMFIKEIQSQQINYKMAANPKAIDLLDRLIAKLEQSIQATVEEKPKIEEVKEVETVKEKKEPKKKKGDNKKQEPQKPKLPPGADQDILAFSECDLRISEIVECWKHPQSTYLYCQKILVGKQLREIASGLQEYIPIEEMRGKVIVFANLKARPLGGFNSNGMVICASNQPQNQFDLLSPEGPLGERLYLDGFEELFQTGEEILPIIKKKTLDKCKQYFSTDAEGFVIWKGHKLRTKAGFVKSKITNGLVD